jgi:hypothetical protein
MRFIEEYLIVLEEMPKVFSTNQFIDQLRKIGVAERIIYNSNHIDFIQQNCIKLSKRTYQKKSNMQYQENDNLKQRILDAINLLKSHGYKILKPITQYEEL